MKDLLSYAVIVALVTLGFGVLALGEADDFIVAKALFILSCLLLAAKVILWRVGRSRIRMSYLIVFVCCGVIGVLALEAIQYVNRKYDKKVKVAQVTQTQLPTRESQKPDQQQSSKPQAVSSEGQDSTSPQNANQSQPLVSEPIPPATTAEEAAEHYRRTSPTLKREEIREAYKEYCDKIAHRFGLTGWSPVNQLTRMVDTNMGDVDAYERAEAEFPSTAWVAIRVLVAFETKRERPMYMSYVFIGRTPTGEEIVALFNESKEWKILSRSSSSTATHEQLIFDTTKQELERLGEKIAPDIRRLG